MKEEASIKNYEQGATDKEMRRCRLDQYRGKMVKRIQVPLDRPASSAGAGSKPQRTRRTCQTENATRHLWRVPRRR